MEQSTLKDMISRRRSVRAYRPEMVDPQTLAAIRQFGESLTPLYPERPYRMEILEAADVRSVLPWLPGQMLAFFSEEREGDLTNIGFLFQQMDLFLQSLGLGSCWIGMGKLSAQGEAKTDRKDGMKLAILLAFGVPAEEPLRKDPTDFKRRSLEEISDRRDPRLEPARLAPSSINSQPWYFAHEQELLHVYCEKPNLLKHKALERFHQIDMGIALAHLFVANPDTFRFFKVETPPQRKGYDYVGSLSLS